MTGPEMPRHPGNPVTGWRSFTDLHLAELLTDSLAYAMAHAATQVITRMQEEIAGLRAELDRYQGRTVYHCTEAQLSAAMAQCLDAQTGDIVRATDTGTEFVARREFADQVSWELRSQ